jgi:hypothetical protein
VPHTGEPVGRDEFSSPGPDFWVDLSPLLRAVAFVYCQRLAPLGQHYPLDNRLF